MTDEPDNVVRESPIDMGYIKVYQATRYYPLALSGGNGLLCHVNSDLSVELVEGATIREALAALVLRASMGMAPEGIPEALADAIIRMAREDDRDE